MTRILFVDDEVRVLDGIRRMLWKYRDRWEMQFAPGPHAAIACLREKPFDVLISDMRMAEMDGAALLEIAMQESPATVRVVLSGQTEAGATERAAAVAHRFLSKPCDPNDLAETITSIEDYRRLVPDRSTQAAIGRVGSIPSPPRLYDQLEGSLAESSTTAALSTLVRSDAGLTAATLRLVSSSFFGRARGGADLDGALGSVGLGRMRSVVLALRNANAAVVDRLCPGLSLEAESLHARVTAAVARAIAPDSVDADCAWIAGLLHDVGKLIGCAWLRDGLGALVARASELNVPLTDLESHDDGPTHGGVGGYLLGLWGLRPDVVAAVVHHHAPMCACADHSTLAATVHVADVLACYVAAATDNAGRIPALDDAALAHIGGERVLDIGRRVAWQALAGEARSTLGLWNGQTSVPMSLRRTVSRSQRVT